MPSLPRDADTWADALPLDYAHQVVPPDRFQTFRDHDARASMTVGRDTDDRRCFLHHRYTEVEDRFDIDEFPIEVPVGREHKTAWRLQDGRWLLLVEQVTRLESCRPKVQSLPLRLLTEGELGM